MNIMADKAHYESHLEAYIVQKLQAQGWVIGQSKNYHTEYALYPEDLITWIQATQPEKATKTRYALYSGLSSIYFSKAIL
jgi:type I restriction enzyme, R subunit